MRDILNVLPAGYALDAGDDQTFVVDVYGRLNGFRFGDPIPEADVSYDTPFGPFQLDNGEFFAHAFLPENAERLFLRTISDGSAFVSYYDANTGATVSLVYSIIDDGQGGQVIVAMEERFNSDGSTSKRVFGGDVPPTMDGVTDPAFVGELSGETAATAMAQLNTRPFDLAPFLGTIGSSIGSYLGGTNPVAQVVSSSLVSTVALNLGQALQFSHVSGAAKVGTDIDQWFDNFGGELAEAFGQAAIGSVSSFLSMELADTLGLEGFGSELFSTATGSVLSQVFENARELGASELFTGISFDNAIGGVAEVGETVNWQPGFLASAIGSFLGSKLGAQVVSIETEAAGILSSIGSAAGSYVFGAGAAVSGQIGAFAAGLAKSLGQLGNFIVPGVGAFIGFVLGALIGNLFGSKKPEIPTADAETVLDFNTGYYALGAVSSQNGGNEDLVRDMALAARDTLNGLIETVVFGAEIAGNANVTSPTQVYGHTGGQLWVKLGSQSATKQNVTSADEAVDKGVLWAIDRTEIVGGDLYMKRAIANSTADSVMALAGDMQIAEDYGVYLANREIINAAIAEPYESLSASDKTALAARGVERGAPAAANDDRQTRNLGESERFLIAA